MGQGSDFRWSTASFRCMMGRSKSSRRPGEARPLRLRCHERTRFSGPLAMQNSEFRIQTSSAPRAGRLALFAFCILHSALLASACATKAKAATTVPDGPPLAMPEPPPRVILLVEDIPAPPPPAPAPEPAVIAKPPANSKPPTARTEPPVVAAQPAPPPPAATEPPR